MTLYKDEMLYSNNQIHVYGSNIVGSRRPENNVCWLALSNIWKGNGKAKGIRLIVLYPPKRSHDLPSLAGGAVI